MRSKFLVSVTLTALLVSIAAFAAPDSGSVKKGKAVARAVSLLPESDAVVVFEAKRFLNDSMPKILSANQTLLGQIMGHISAVENQTGIDLRKFDQVAVGITFKQVSATETDYEPIAVATGDMNAGALVAMAKTASKGSYREVTVAGKTVYVFPMKNIAPKAPAAPAAAKPGLVDKVFGGFSKDVAVAAMDANTLLIGSLAKVTETLNGTSHVAADVTSLLTARDTTVMTFGGRTKGTLAKMLPLDTDLLGQNINSIQFMSGSLDVTTAGTELQMMARTSKPAQAQGLKDTLDGLQTIGKGVLGNSKAPDKQVYGRMLSNAKIVAQGTDVSLNVVIPQADIDVLVARIK